MEWGEAPFQEAKQQPLEDARTLIGGAVIVWLTTSIPLDIIAVKLFF
jgi:hypothetical protein